MGLLLRHSPCFFAMLFSNFLLYFFLTENIFLTFGTFYVFLGFHRTPHSPHYIYLWSDLVFCSDNYLLMKFSLFEKLWKRNNNQDSSFSETCTTTATTTYSYSCNNQEKGTQNNCPVLTHVSKSEDRIESVNIGEFQLNISNFRDDNNISSNAQAAVDDKKSSLPPYELLWIYGSTM